MTFNQDTVKDYFAWDPQADPQFASLIVGEGHVGGKGRSLLFAMRQLWDQDEELAQKVIFPPSIYLAISVYEHLLEQIPEKGTLADQDPKIIEASFLRTTLPGYVTDAIRSFLAKTTDPIIVRSSSFLEDSLKFSFAGKYLSTFLINDQPDLEERVRNVENEIKRIYSRIFFPIAIAYRKKHRLGNDSMGIIIMRVSGKWRGKYYYPTLAGVGFSRYYRRWTNRIKPDDGVIRLVFGMGTMCTKRGYARSISLTLPSLRPEGQNPFNIMRHSQEHFQLVDKDQRGLTTCHIKDIWGDIVPYHTCFPDYAQVYTPDVTGGYFNRMCKKQVFIGKDSKICFTFEEFACRYKHFFHRMRKILKILETSMGVPADIEFSFHPAEDLIELVQARPLWIKDNPLSGDIPDLQDKKIILRGDRMVTDGAKINVPHIVYLDYKIYSKTNRWHDIARAIGIVNKELGNEKYILVAPGRVGSSNPLLGVPVSYNEITNCCCIVELGLPREGFMPELSFGTHFFTDLEIDEILYMPVYHGEPNNLFDEKFFEGQPYVLGPDTAVRVYSGSFSVYTDGRNNRGNVVVNSPQTTTSGQGKNEGPVEHFKESAHNPALW